MLKVLLVDDEPFIIQGLKVLIDWEQEGYMIAGTASNGKEAYDFLKKESVDLIIADIQMPVMTGLDLQEAIRKENLSGMQYRIHTSVFGIRASPDPSHLRPHHIPPSEFQRSGHLLCISSVM